MPRRHRSLHCTATSTKQPQRNVLYHFNQLLISKDTTSIKTDGYGYLHFSRYRVLEDSFMTSPKIVTDSSPLGSSQTFPITWVNFREDAHSYKR